MVRNRQRGQLTSLAQRQQCLEWFHQAITEGARRRQAADILNISLKTLNRWQDKAGKTIEDQRPLVVKDMPANKLSKEEEKTILNISNQKEFSRLPPCQIVPMLADRGTYIASESSWYRVLRRNGQLTHRGRSKKPHKRRKPTTHIATGANQVWTWDISYLPSRTKGLFWYLYLIVDIYSRKIVGWEVYEVESGEYAKVLVERTLLSENCSKNPPVLHSDNGAPMKSFTFKARLEELGVGSSYSRPRVSNDNPYSESLFRTVKYCPEYPSSGFVTLDDARSWMLKFARWYNHEHRHSGIKFVTPHQRHNNEDKQLLEKRVAVYELAKSEHPERWPGAIRDWSHINEVALNPERERAGIN